MKVEASTLQGIQSRDIKQRAPLLRVTHAGNMALGHL